MPKVKKNEDDGLFAGLIDTSRPITQNIVNQKNVLIEGRTDTTLNQQKILLAAASYIQPEDPDFKPLSIELKDLAEYMELDSKGSYAQIRKDTLALIGKSYEIYENDEITQVALLAQARYKKHKGKVELMFAPALKPYLLDLHDGNYTSAPTRVIGRFRSIYSLRIYLVLRQYLPIGYRVLTINWMRERFGIPKGTYKEYANFKQKVILVAQQELNKKADLGFDFMEIKKGRKVEAIKFLIHKNKLENLPTLPELNTQKNNPFTQEVKAIFAAQDVRIPEEEWDKIIEAFIELTLSTKEITKIAQELRYQAMYGIRMAISHFQNDPKEIARQILTNKFGAKKSQYELYVPNE